MIVRIARQIRQMIRGDVGNRRRALTLERLLHQSIEHFVENADRRARPFDARIRGDVFLLWFRVAVRSVVQRQHFNVPAGANQRDVVFE